MEGMVRTHYLLTLRERPGIKFTACRRYLGVSITATKVIAAVDCKRCLTAMTKVWGRIPSPAELAATEADTLIKETL